MRVSDSMNYIQTTQAIGKNRSELSDLQTQAATQKRINKPSDDPVGTTKLYSSRTNEQNIDQYLKNLDFAKSFLDYTDSSLDELSSTIMRAKELALSQANDPSANESSRRAVATEVRQLYNQALQVANRRLGTRYVFGGYDTTQKPFGNQGDYHGDRGEMMIEINKGDYVAMNIPGDVVFLGREARRNGVLNSTPDSIQELESTQSKEIQNRENQKAQPTEFLRGPASEQPQTLDSKQSDFAQDISYFYGGENIFRVLKELEIGLMSDNKSVIQDQIERLDTSLDQIVHARAKVGSRVTNLQNTMDILNKSKVDEKAKQSTIEDVDAYQLFSKLSQNDSTLKATMTASAKILQPSLLDFLK